MKSMVTKKIKVALGILSILILVSIGINIIDSINNKAYHKLLEQTSVMAKEQSGSDVSYILKEGKGVTAIAYVPHDTQNSAINELAKIMQSKVESSANQTTKKDTVYILYAKKNEAITNTIVYDIYQDEYHYQNKTYEKVTSQLFRTLVKADEWLVLNQMLDVATLDTQIVIQKIKSDIEGTHLSVDDKKEIISQVTEDNLSHLPYVYTKDVFGLVFTVKGQEKVVVLDPSSVVVYFKTALLYDTYRENLSAQLRDVQSERATKIIEAGNELLNKVANSGTTKKIALTFDDGPHPTRTSRVLDILKEENIKATFFVLGKNVYNNQEILKRTYAEGHQIGSHGWSHDDLRTLSQEDVKSEFEKTQQIIHQVIGQTPTILRPPYGSIDARVNQMINVAIIQWSVDSYDWKLKNSAKIIDRVVADTTGGSIILLHDIHEESVQAVKSIIQALKAKGFEFVTINELYGANNILPNIQYFSSNNVRVIK